LKIGEFTSLTEIDTASFSCRFAVFLLIFQGLDRPSWPPLNVYKVQVEHEPFLNSCGYLLLRVVNILLRRVALVNFIDNRSD